MRVFRRMAAIGLGAVVLMLLVALIRGDAEDLPWGGIIGVVVLIGVAGLALLRAGRRGG